MKRHTMGLLLGLGIWVGTFNVATAQDDAELSREIKLRVELRLLPCNERGECPTTLPPIRRQTTFPFKSVACPGCDMKKAVWIGIDAKTLDIPYRKAIVLTEYRERGPTHYYLDIMNFLPNPAGGTPTPRLESRLLLSSNWDTLPNTTRWFDIVEYDQKKYLPVLRVGR